MGEGLSKRLRFWVEDSLKVNSILIIGGRGLNFLIWRLGYWIGGIGLFNYSLKGWNRKRGLD